MCFAFLVAKKFREVKTEVLVTCVPAQKYPSASFVNAINSTHSVIEKI